MSTSDNLQAAFAGESQANRKYTAYARKADEEGFPGVARLFRAAAEAETVHALAHFQVMGMVGSTEDNLRAALQGETYEFQQMYPGFIEEAKAEGNEAAAMSFTGANAVEKIHAGLYERAVANPAGMTAERFYVCQVCGNTVENEAPDPCPICGAKKEMFKAVD